jgi:hypothetical protein
VNAKPLPELLNVARFCVNWSREPEVKTPSSQSPLSVTFATRESLTESKKMPAK